MATPLAPIVTLRRGSQQATSTYAESAAPDGCAAFVACTWSGTAGWERSLRVMPDGCVDIAWDGQTLVLTPATESVLRVQLRSSTPTVGVRLRSAAAAAVAGDAVRDVEGPVLLRELWPAPAVEGVQSMLRGAPTADAANSLAAAVVAHATAAGRSPDRRLHEAIEHLRRPSTSVAYAAAAVGWSVRQLHRRCVDDTGLAPKTLQQVLRFHATLPSIGSQPLAHVAAERGYADQAHLTRAVRRHAGTTPRSLARQRNITSGRNTEVVRDPDALP